MSLAAGFRSALRRGATWQVARGVPRVMVEGGVSLAVGFAVRPEARGHAADGPEVSYASWPRRACRWQSASPAAIAEGRTVVVLQQAQCAPPHRAGGVVVLASHDAAASQTLLDVVSPAGVHEVAEAPADLAREALARQLRAAFDDGVRRDGEPEPDLALFVTVLTDGAARVDRVTRGKCETGGFEVVSGVPTFVAARGAATPDGALAVLAA